MAKGTYQIAINGFRCTNETWDDALNRDGNHDEIFFVVNTRVTKAGVDVTPPMDAASIVMGDINGFPGRIMAGSGATWWGKQSGGLVSGDSYPSTTPWAQSIDPSGRDFPPYTIWQGDLTQGSDEVVFLTPTIWELDTGGDALQGWIDWQVSVNAKFGVRAKEIVGGIYPAANAIFDAVSLGIETFATIPGIWNSGGSPKSRPIGLQRDPANEHGTKFNPMIISLTYDLAEYLVNSNMTGKGKGIITYRYLDDPILRGDYQIWLQIKKFPGEPPIDDFLAKEASDSNIYIIYAGAKFLIPDMATLYRLYGVASMVNTVPDGNLIRFGAIPKDGTILREENAVYIWLMEAGKKRHITTPRILGRYGGWDKVRVVPDYALNNIPIGTPIKDNIALRDPSVIGGFPFRPIKPVG